jgi:type I restriction enzyme S subunit
MSKVYLKDVVTRIKDKVDKDNTDLEYYIGGEHFDNGEIQITKKGVIAGSTIGPAFHMRFVPGDVLLMSRNPHLRKAGVVDFEGICSDVSYVCRTKDENVLMQKFLPFIFQSDDFWRFAEENKKGSTNFFLNWSDFEKYEFNLPPIETQRKLVEILWSFEDTKTAYKKLLDKTDELVKSQFIEMFGDTESNPMGWKESTLKEICVGKLSYGSGAAATEYDGETRYVRITDITENGELSNDVKSPNAIDEKYLLNDGDILFARSGATVGKTLMHKAAYGRCIYAGFLIRLVPDTSKVLPDYVFGFTKSAFYEDFVRRTQRAVGQPNINAQEYGDLKICIPPMSLQKQFAEFLHQSDKSKFELKQAIADIDNLARALMQQELN